MISAVQNGQEVTGTLQSPRTRDIRAHAGTMRPTDTVCLSRAGQLMSCFFSGLGIDHTPGRAVSLAEMEQGLKTTRERFERDAGQALLQEGIPLDPPATLTSDHEGRIRVQGDHPYKEQIEAVFDDNPRLSNEFRKTSSLASLVQAGKEYLEFARKYEEDPHAAVADYSFLFDGHETEAFSLVLGES